MKEYPYDPPAGLVGLKDLNPHIYAKVCELEKHIETQSAYVEFVINVGVPHAGVLRLYKSLVAVCPECLDGIKDERVRAYQGEILEVIATLLCSEFARKEGFVAVLKDLCDARDAIKYSRIEGAKRLLCVDNPFVKKS